MPCKVTKQLVLGIRTETSLKGHYWAHRTVIYKIPFSNWYVRKGHCTWLWSPTHNNQQRRRLVKILEIPGHKWHSLTSPRTMCNQPWPTFALAKTADISCPGYYDSLPMFAIALLQFYLHRASKRILLYPSPSLQCLATACRIKANFFLWPSNPCMIWLLSPSLLFGFTLSLTYSVHPHWLLL